MKTAVRMVALSFLTLGSLAVVGCQSNSPSGVSAYAGGDGVFGEDPSKPGAYRNSSQVSDKPAPTASADAR